MKAKWPTPPKLWRIRGRAADGLLVTLGRYATQAEAEVDLERLRQEGAYHKLELLPLPTAPAGDAQPP